MAESGLQDKTITGMLWTSIGKFGTMGLQFLSNLVLARLLMPSDYGAIGMLNVFIAVSGIFVTAGFGSALIQKKKPTHLDYTSVFYWNLFAAVVIYLILFLFGPTIAHFYKIPELCIILRIQSISLIIQAFATVQSNQLQKQLRFRELSIRNVVATLIGTIIAIIMALLGYGVWSLVVSSLVSSLAGVFLLWKMSSWRPTWEFSFQSLRDLFAFGGLMALSSFVETVYSNIQGLIIGRWYTAADLGYYTQAKKLEMVPSSAITSVVNQVSFPVFSGIQDEKTRFVNGMKKSIKATAFLSFPLMIMLAVISEPLIILLYGEKWCPSVPYFMLLCLGGVMSSINCINTNSIIALGKSKVYFFLQLSKRLIGIGMIIWGMQYSVLGMVAGAVSLFYIAFIINGFVNGKLIGYGLMAQIKDILPYLLLSGLLGIVVFYGGRCFVVNRYVVMFCQIFAYCTLFCLFSKLFKFEEIDLFEKVAVEKIGKFIKIKK